MGVLQMFVAEDELSEIIKDFARRRQLSGYVLDGQVYRRYNAIEQPIHYQGKAIKYPFYLAPPTKPDLADVLDKNVIQPRYDGWISVTVGERVAHNGRDVLTMTTISGEDNLRSPVKAGSWIRALKKTVAKQIHFGVNGRIFGCDGHYFYRDLGYSDAAHALLKNGVFWMQYETDNGDFSPPELPK